MINRIILSDLHLDDNPLNSYRWEIFSWIDDLAKKYSINRVDILGDITDKKDRHSSILVNNFITATKNIKNIKELNILKGNHDYIEETIPFFKFLNTILGIKFIYTPEVILDTLFIPHTKEFKLQEYEKLLNPNIKCVYIHQIAINAIFQNNTLSTKGIDNNIFENYIVFSGDIHSPQKIGNIIYVGSPYPINFGDNYKGRCIIIKNNKIIEEIYPNQIQKLFLKLNSNFTEKDFLIINPNDQVKVTIELEIHETYNWENIQREVKNLILKRNGILVSLEMKLKRQSNNTEYIKKQKKETDLEIIERFLKNENVDLSFLEYAKKLLNDNTTSIVGDY